jgi:hypothetical protein
MQKAFKKLEVVTAVEPDKLEQLIQDTCTRLIEEVKNGASKREKIKLAKIFNRLGQQFAV